MKKNYNTSFNFCKVLTRNGLKNIQYFAYLFVLFLGLGASNVYGQLLPDEFSKVELAVGMTNTTTFKFAPDGRIFILDRYGEILIYENSAGVQVSGGTIPVFHELEDGLLGIAFDPDFITNNILYLYYSPVDFVGNRVSQFTMNGNTLDLSSEVTLLQWQTNRVALYHSGGDMDFDSQGNLLIATGDNTTYPNLNTAISLSNTITAANEIASAEKSSSNTNDFRGKILRITPDAQDNYTIPSGNLFPGGSGGLPEIYVMGARNPYRIFVDKESGNDWLYWGEVGPDASTASTAGPAGMDEINLTKNAENAGWPYFLGTNNDPYQVVYNGPTPFYNDPLAPQNTSVYNTGVTSLPEAQPAWMAFDNKCYLAGFRYYHDANQADDQRLPVEFDGKFFFYDFNSSRIWVVTINADGSIVEDTSSIGVVPQFAPAVFPNADEGFIDMELGPDGKMYILAYGVPCCESDAGPTGKLIRVDYTGITPNSPPVIELSADQTNGGLPLIVSFSTAGTTDPNGDVPLTYEWDFDMDGNTDSTDPNPTHTFTTAGTINVQLKVNDGNAVNGQSIKNMTIYAGNTIATFIVNSPVDGGLFNWGDDVTVDIVVQDTEDGVVDCNNATLQPGFGHLTHVHPEVTTTTCAQTLNIAADAGHGTDGELDIFGSFSLEYEDNGGLISRDLITLHPKRKEAEFFNTESGTTVIANTDPLEGGLQALRVDAGGHISFSGRNLFNIAAVKYKVAAAAAGGSIEMRVGSVTGTVLATTAIPATGGTSTWVNVETNFTDPGGKNDLYFVFTGTGSAIFDLNYVEFLGDGTSIDNTPPTIENVSAINSTTVSVQFSEYINESTAEALGNYAIDNAISISSAVLQPDGRTVFLTVSNLDASTGYNVTVSNVQNTSGFPIVTNSYPFDLVGDIRINSGGPQVIWSGDTFITDQFGIGGMLYTDAIPIDGTTDDELYQSEIFGPAGGTFSYEIPVGVAANYDIRLHFAELFFGVGSQTGGSGSRVFDVSIEGTTVLSNFDILSEVAPATALAKEFNNVLINDGFASIVFTGVTQSAKINGIEILDENTFGEPTDADITITSPSNGWDVNQPFEVAFRVENWTIAQGDTHAHYSIDGMTTMTPYYSYEPISIDNLSIGEHTIKIELFNSDHTATGIFDEVTVNVTGALTCNETPFPDQWGVKQLETTSLPTVSVYTFADFDLDGDGLKDIVTGAWWYKNPGTIQGNWVRSDIGNTFNNVAWVHDFDNDGDLDLLGTTGAYEGADLVWAQNDGTGNFTVYSNIPSGNTTYSEPFLAGIAGGVFTVGGEYQMAINWNGAENTGSPMELLTPSANPTMDTWSLVTLSPDSTGEDIQVGDIDQDNDLDLFQGTNWLENDLSVSGNWVTHSTGITYATTPDRAQLADFDRDGDLDAVVGQLSAFTTAANAGEFSWFAAPDDPTQPWVRNILDTDINGSLSVFAIDFDFDGDKDIIVGEWIGDYRLIAFENDLCNSGSFIKTIINPGIPGQEHHDGARVTDIDNDGDLDVISNGWFVPGSSEVRNFPRIYENQTIPAADDEPVVDSGGDQNILNDTATLNGSASDPDGGAIVSYQWTQESGPSTAVLSGDTTATLTASDLTEGVYIFRLTATDDESDIGFDDAIITVSSQSDAIRINSGGPTYSFDTTTWSADQHFNAGAITTVTTAIANTNNDQLYQTERYATSGDLIYEIPVANGEYNVNLHFAEIFYGVPGGAVGGIGARIFNVDIENGTETLLNYDIIAQAGGSATAIVESFTNVTVTDGTLTITLTGVVELPKISGIEVIVAGSSIAPVVFAGEDVTISLPNNSFTLDGSATDPDGGEIMSYVWSQVSGPSTATFSNMNVSDPDVSDLEEGDYVFSLTATDDEGTMVSDEVTITVESQPLSLLINSGGPSYTFTTEEWSADQFFVGGSVFPTIPNAVAIANTENDELYQTERFSTSGTLVYEIPVDNGTYNVDLHFAELFYGVAGTTGESGGVGSRVFNIQVENGTTIDNYDIFVAANGSLAAVIESLKNIEVTDGMLTITLTGVTENPKISGIGIFETRPPSVDAGLDQTIILPANGVVLTGSGSDPDGGMVSYQWSEQSGPATANLVGADTSVLTASDLVEGTYVFILTVTDDEGETAFDEVLITVLPDSNTTMITASAGEDQTLTLPENSSTLNGSGSASDGSAVSYQWTQQSGPSTANVVGADTAGLTANDLVEGIYVFRLTVTNAAGESSSDEVLITVLADGTTTMITADAGEDQTVTLPENSITLSGSGSSSDGSAVSYQWTQQTGPSMDAILSDADTENLSLTGLEFGEYTFRLTVTDVNGETSFNEVTVNVVLATTRMNIILQVNPVKEGIVRIEIENQPEDTRVMNFTIHDVGGRYIAGFPDPESLDFEEDGYLLPVYTLEDGLYFVRVTLNQGKPTLLKLLIKN
jgi:glucose/arabinose dehydrogenase/PKD repeat protein